MFGDNRYLIAAEKAADYTWEKGLLTKGLQICHGISGNIFLLYHVLKNKINIYIR